MNKNLNQDLYSRFGIKLNLKEVQNGFCNYLKNLLFDTLNPLINTENYKDNDKLFKIQQKILKEACREIFLDYNDYNNSDYGFSWFIKKEFCNGDFKETILRLQILLDIIFKHKFVRYELYSLTEEINLYLQDYPILGFKIKIYKTKSPQILTSISKFFNKEIDDLLGLLETNKYKDILINFEKGLKEFLQAKTGTQLKNVVNSMLSACDELSKIIFNDQNKGFKHIFNRSNNQNNWIKFGLNGKQKEIFKNLKEWMDSIKHGSVRKINRSDVEMIISLIASFIRFSVNYHESI